eukprot:203207-Chlamydomonas_euryale.AAC.5
MGKRLDGTLHPTAQMCTAAGVPQLMHVLNAVQLTGLGHVARMPDGSVVKQLLFASWWYWVTWSLGHAPHGRIGL